MRDTPLQLNAEEFLVCPLYFRKLFQCFIFIIKELIDDECTPFHQTSIVVLLSWFRPDFWLLLLLAMAFSDDFNEVVLFLDMLLLEFAWQV